MSPPLRSAGPADAARIADLHADSWRRHYRGAYSDSFLDGDVSADRRRVWSGRLAAPDGTHTLVAEEGERLLGFVHVIFDRDPEWGSLIDNLHVVHDRQRSGIGRRLLAGAAEAVTARTATTARYLWVLEQNTRAQAFYRAAGGSCAQTSTVVEVGGDPSRLQGNPRCLRVVWR